MVADGGKGDPGPSPGPQTKSEKKSGDQEKNYVPPDWMQHMFDTAKIPQEDHVTMMKALQNAQVDSADNMARMSAEQIVEESRTGAKQPPRIKLARAMALLGIAQEMTGMVQDAKPAGIGAERSAGSGGSPLGR